jgi:hypothetical protein
MITEEARNRRCVAADKTEVSSTLDNPKKKRGLGSSGRPRIWFPADSLHAQFTRSSLAQPQIHGVRKPCIFSWGDFVKHGTVHFERTNGQFRP